MRLFSYVVDHDTGFAPNPSGRFCTLVHCKRKTVKRNIVELAEEGDWIIGTGGKNKKSCGNCKVIYIMRVDKKIPFTQYLRDPRFQGRIDCIDLNKGNEFALISTTFFYFGQNAIPVSVIPVIGLNHPIEKKGPGFRSDFTESFIRHFTDWVQKNYKVGKHGDPCAPDPGYMPDGGGECPQARQPRCRPPVSKADDAKGGKKPRC